MNAPLNRPETIDWYGSEHPRRGEHAVVVEDDPDGTEHAAERPVTEEDVDGEEEHGKGGHDQIGDGKVADQDGERRAQFLLELVGQQDEEISDGADDDDDEQERAENDQPRCEHRPGMNWTSTCEPGMNVVQVWTSISPGVNVLRPMTPVVIAELNPTVVKPSELLLSVEFIIL